MPKKSKYPKFRTSRKKGKGGQTWVSHWYDMRGTGKPDTPLGTNYEEALAKWHEIHFDAPRIAGTLEEAFRGWEERGITERPDGTPRSPETIKGYRKCLAALRPVFQGARWHEIDLPALVAYRKARSAKGRARQELQLISVIWGWARLEGLTALPFPGEGMQRTGWKGPAGVRQLTVEQEAFAAIYRHADQTLKDAMDIASATGVRGQDVPRLLLSDALNGTLVNVASKNGKVGEFEVAASTVLPPLIERRKALRGTEHMFLLANYERPKRPVTYRMLYDRFVAARAEAAKELPACAKLWLRDMRKYACQLAPSLAEASKLLQHSSISVTQRHYRQGDKLKPVR